MTGLVVELESDTGDYLPTTDTMGFRLVVAPRGATPFMDTHSFYIALGKDSHVVINEVSSHSMQTSQLYANQDGQSKLALLRVKYASGSSKLTDCSIA